MAEKKSALIKRAQKIKLIAMDVDGVLTNGDVIVLESGEEVKAWNAKDRLGMAVVREQKVPLIFAWITGRTSKAVESCALDLGIHHVVQKCSDKKKALDGLLKSHQFSFDQAAFVGDDLIDLPLLNAVGFSACPIDAVRDVRERVHYVSPLAGGRGVGRDVLEFILRAQNKWDALLKPFLS